MSVTLLGSFFDAYAVHRRELIQAGMPMKSVLAALR